MIKLRISKILDLLIESSYLGAIFLIPLYFSIFPKTSNVFELNKIVLFRIIILLLLFFSFASFIFKHSLKKRIFAYIKKRGRYIIIPAICLLGLSVIVIFSDFIKNSFWGSYERQLGLYSYLFFFLFFLLLIVEVRKKEQINRILMTISLSAFLVCIYGLIQVAGLDPLGWSESTKERIFSTLGQPNFLASYLLLVLPISGYLFWEFKNKFLKIFFGLIFLMQLFCIIFTYSRAAEIGLIAGSVLFLGYYIFRNGRNSIIFTIKKRTYFFIITGVIIFLGLLWTSFSTDQKTRIKWTFDISQGSTASRANFWGASLKAWPKKPFFGYGLENQSEALAGYYDKDWAIFNNVNAITDRAHNIILDNLLAGGILGLIIFLLLNAYFVRLVLLNIKNNRYKNLSLSILFGWTCYMISLLFSFVTVVVEIYFWLYLALAVIISAPLDDSYDLAEGYKMGKKRKIFLFIFKIVCVLIFGAGIFYQLNREIKIIVADLYFYKLESSLASREYYTAFIFYDWIKELKVDMKYYDRTMSNALVNAIDKNTNEVWGEGAKILVFPKSVISLQGDSFANVCVRAKVYGMMASDKKPEFYSKAEESFNLCIKKSKNLPGSYREFAKYYFKKGEYDKAIENLNTSLSKLPDLSDKRINKEHMAVIKNEVYLVGILFGDIYAEQKNYEKAREYYFLAKDQFDDKTFTNKKIADAYYFEGKKEEAIGVLKEIVLNDKKNYFWYLSIAQVYNDLKKTELAIEYGKKALEQSPENELVKSFLATFKNNDK